MQDAKEEIRAKLSIEDVIGEYVHLTRSGRNYKGLSPFTGEKTPSFYVSIEKNIWHDFSSNKGGDLFSFIMEVEGIDFKGALELLARRAGVDLSKYDSKSNQNLAKIKRRLQEANQLAASYYQHSLLKNNRALEYVFKKRSLSKKVVQDFMIGYAPDSGDALVKFLIKKGYSTQELAKAGLTNRFGGDLFRARMMVPLMDASGRVIGFTGRVLEDEPNSPKYLNTPETPIFNKGRHVFGLSQAKDSIRKNNYSVIVEGNLDVVSSHQVGVCQVVATAGTAMTEFHLKALVRLSPEIKLAFDGDSAGLAATERAIPIAQKVGADLTIISLPDGYKDPDELIQKDAKLWQKAIDSSEGVVDWLFKQYAKRENMDSPKGKRQYTSVALAVVKQLSDVVEVEHYLHKIAETTNTSVETLKQKLKDIKDDNDKVLRPTHLVEPTPKVDTSAYQDSLLALLLTDDEMRDLATDIKAEMFLGDNRQEVFKYIQNNLKSVQFVPKELQSIETYVKILLFKADARYGQWSSEDRYFETARLIRQIITEHMQKQKEALTIELKVAEDNGDDKEALRLRQLINQIIKEKPRAKR